MFRGCFDLHFEMSPISIKSGLVEIFVHSAHLSFSGPQRQQIRQKMFKIFFSVIANRYKNLGACDFKIEIKNWDSGDIMTLFTRCKRMNE